LKKEGTTTYFAHGYCGSCWFGRQIVGVTCNFVLFENEMDKTKENPVCRHTVKHTISLQNLCQ